MTSISNGNRSSSYMPQLDSLRALAAIGVFMQHFLPETNMVHSMLRPGDLGVRLFFVLSGFLITALLLDGTAEVEDNNVRKPIVLWHFYMRRFIRLMPVYYVTLAIVFLALPWMRQYADWYLLYAQNFLFIANNGFVYAGHFWTLAVEEQFYLLWPLVVLFAPRRWLVPILITTILFAPLLRMLCFVSGMTHFQVSMLAPAHFDTLAMGGLLAVYWYKGKALSDRIRRVLVVSAVAGLGILFLVLVSKILNILSWLELVGGELGAGLLFVCIIGFAADGFSGLLGWLLTVPWLVYLGRISYGMYVYHWFVQQVLQAYGIVPLTNEWLNFIFLSLISIGVAMISWHLMERHIGKLKRHFKVVYSSDATAALPVSK